MIKKIVILFVLVSSFVIAFYFYKNAKTTKEFTYNVYKVENGWGYEIYHNNKLYIHQENIPVLVGNKPFPSQASAKLAAELVEKKLILKKIPSLTENELRDILKH
jgi:hypothetical protein